MQIRRENYSGHWYTTYIQEWDKDCGPTAVAIARHHLTGHATDIDWLRKKSKRPLVSPGIEAAIDGLGLASRDIGTFLEDLPALAKSLGLKATFSFESSLGVVNKLKTSSHERAFIVRVAWDTGGGHAVTVPHVSDGGVHVVLDPYYGLQATSLPPTYRFTASDGSEITGRFSGEIVEVTR